MKIKTAVLTAIVILSCYSTTFAGNGNRAGSYIGCTSETALDELTSAMANNDTRLLQSLTIDEKKCIMIDGLEYSTLDRGIIRSKAKFYLEDGTSVNLWVPSEAVK